jgi:hypothetical protein
MKKSTLDQPEGKDVCKLVEILADGSRITKYTETQTLLDGSGVVKTRVVCTGNLDSPDRAKKEIITTITRTNPDGKVGTIITTEETITDPHATTSEINPGEQNDGTRSTKTYSLPDGSRVIVTKSTSVLTAFQLWSQI